VAGSPGDRFVELALAAQCNAEVGVGVRIVRFDANRLGVCSDRLVKLALTMERNTELGNLTRVLSVPLDSLTD
jgi:hypothetical protein